MNEWSWHLWTDGYRYDPPPEGVPLAIRRCGSTTIEYIDRKEDLPPWFNIANLEWRMILDSGDSVQ